MIEIFRPEEHTPISQSGDEVRYNCPFCEEIRGKADDDGKLYFNVKKDKGYCFKCQVIVYPEGSAAPSDEDELMQACDDSRVKMDPLLLFEGLEKPYEIPFDFEELNAEDKSYLRSRNPFLIPLAPVLGLHAWHGRDSGIVSPFFYRNAVVKFQTRFYARKDWKKGKYYTHHGTKPPYSPRHILNNFKLIGEREVTLCEGTYDAVALEIMGFNNPLAVLGDRLTPLQAWTIRNLCPTRAVVSLDDWDRSMKMKKVLHKLIPSLSDVHIHTKWGKWKDPEEYLVGNIKRDAKFAQECKQRVVAWIKGTK